MEKKSKTRKNVFFFLKCWIEKQIKNPKGELLIDAAKKQERSQTWKTQTNETKKKITETEKRNLRDLSRTFEKHVSGRLDVRIIQRRLE